MHGEQRNAYTVLVGKPEGMRRLGNPFLDWRIILKGILKTFCRGVV